jgi:hypothetical protein
MPCLTVSSGEVRRGRAMAGQLCNAVGGSRPASDLGWGRWHLVRHWLSGPPFGKEISPMSLHIENAYTSLEIDGRVIAVARFPSTLRLTVTARGSSRAA